MIRAYRQDEPGEESDAWLEELVDSRESKEEQGEGNLYCFVCGEIVTRTHQRIVVAGSHRHTFTNPGGYVFEIGCFREAPGCEQAGSFSDFYSWFDGYQWSYAICTSCRVHLGWTYQAAGVGAPGAQGSVSDFFGLVLNRLLASTEYFPSKS